MAAPHALMASDSTQLTAPKLEQQPVLVGNTWGPKSNVLDILQARTSSLKLDCLPPDPFGDIDGQLLALDSKDKQLKKPDLSTVRTDINDDIKRIRESATPTGNKIVGVAQELGRDPERWQSNTTGKCNQFVGEVIQDSTGKTCWNGPTPDCHGLRKALAGSSDWQCTWSSYGKTFEQAVAQFQNYKPHDGEVAIWDNSERQHSGILDADRQLYYAGSRVSKTGYAKTDIKYYTGTPDKPMDYGAPTAIYRHKNSD